MVRLAYVYKFESYTILIFSTWRPFLLFGFDFFVVREREREREMIRTLLLLTLAVSSSNAITNLRTRSKLKESPKSFVVSTNYEDEPSTEVRFSPHSTNLSLAVHTNTLTHFIR